MIHGFIITIAPRVRLLFFNLGEVLRKTKFGEGGGVADVTKGIEVLAPIGVKRIVEYYSKSGELATRKPLSADVGKHVFRDGICYGKLASKNLVADKIPPNTEMSGGTKTARILSNL